MNRRLWGGGAVALLLLAVAAVGPAVAPHDPNRQDLVAVRQPPVWAGGAWAHALGTDSLGRDILSRLLWGARVAVIVAVASAAISAAVGVPVALVAGYARGRVDTLLMRITDIFLAFPRLVMALAFVAAIGPGIENAVIAIAITAWPPYARVARAETLTLRNSDFINAVRLQGGTQSARLLLLAGAPLGEPVARYGPFVMNTERELLQAFEDYRSGRMGEITRTARLG